MNNNSRALFLVIALVAAVVCATPGAAAAEGGGDGDDENAKGEKFCQRVVGLKACVAVLYGSCTLWVSAGTGGCVIGDGEEVDAYATTNAA